MAGSANSRSMGPNAETVLMSILALSSVAGAVAGDGASSISMTSVISNPVTAGCAGVVVGMVRIGSVGFSTVVLGDGGRSVAAAGVVPVVSVGSASFSGVGTSSGCGAAVTSAALSDSRVAASCWSFGPACSSCSGPGPISNSVGSEGGTAATGLTASVAVIVSSAACGFSVVATSCTSGTGGSTSGCATEAIEMEVTERFSGSVSLPWNTGASSSNGSESSS